MDLLQFMPFSRKQNECYCMTGRSSGSFSDDHLPIGISTVVFDHRMKRKLHLNLQLRG